MIDGHAARANALYPGRRLPDGSLARRKRRPHPRGDTISDTGCTDISNMFTISGLHSFDDVAVQWPAQLHVVHHGVHRDLPNEDTR